MSGFILIGGTALSIQIGHRLSEDLDFWLPMEKMSKTSLDSIVSKLRTFGHQVKLVTPAWKITQSKINGVDLLALSRDYVVDGVKVTFFARNDTPYQYFSTLHRVQNLNNTFEIMSSDSIFEIKSWLISQRVRSRDIFDLMVMLQDQGKTMRDILDAGRQADASYNPEYAKEVLIGSVPLDEDDEGFDSIALNAKIDDIYHFFSDRVALYEQAVAEEILRRIIQT